MQNKAPSNEPKWFAVRCCFTLWELTQFLTTFGGLGKGARKY
jgi:hypothetical protein